MWKTIWLQTLCVGVVLWYVSIIPAQATPYLRNVVVIYNSQDNQSTDSNFIRQNVEGSLHYLGLDVRYWNIQQGLPSDRTMQECRGIIVHLMGAPIPSPNAYLGFVQRQLAAGKKVVFLNQVVPANTQPKKVNAALFQTGLQCGSDSTWIPSDIRIAYQNQKKIGFERTLTSINAFYETRSISPKNQVYLRLTKKSTRAQSDAIVTGPWGGMALGDTLMTEESAINKRAFYIDPIWFFSEALGIQNAPRPDVTSLNGARVVYCHIDGDGFNNISRIGENRLSSQIIQDAILKKYPRILNTVSVIASDIDPKWFGKRQAVNVAREIFSLPNVEVGSHTFSHPLIWDRRILPSDDQQNAYQKQYKTMHWNGVALLPHAMKKYVYNPKAEVLDSVDYINQNLMPKEKQCRLVQWSGNCFPNWDSLKLLSDKGLLNINGMGTKMDDDTPSLAFLSPIYRQVNGYTQVYATSFNENNYTELLTENFGRYRYVTQTFNRTGHPRRLTPVNAYYHFYSGEHQASLSALKRIYEWIDAQQTRHQLFPIYTSRYCEMVMDARKMRIEDAGNGVWQIRQNGACRTIRFDGPTRHVDMANSKGVLGYFYGQTALYVHLDESQHHQIVLSNFSTKLPFLKKATADVEELQITRNRIVFRSPGFRSGQFIWENLVPNDSYAVWVNQKKVCTIQANQAGTVELVRL